MEITKMTLPAFLITILLVLTIDAPAGVGDNADSALASIRRAQDQVPEVNGMVYIPAGDFIMGSSNEALHQSAEIDEFPQRTVWVDGFYMDLHEVTNIEYKVFVDSMKVRPPHHWKNGSYPVGRDGYPVAGISWFEAMKYAHFVGKRLPTETEWEKAARGTDGRRYPWGNDFDNKKTNNGDHPMAIMQYSDGRSPYGLYDMAGNVAEWVDTWFAAYPREEFDELDEDVSNHKPMYGKKKYRVYRGGSWNNYGKYLRCANREKEKPTARWSRIGFRCAMDLPAEGN
jgi:formylglycine-generating enzyme required for sulfatase activity